MHGTTIRPAVACALLALGCAGARPVETAPRSPAAPPAAAARVTVHGPPYAGHAQNFGRGRRFFLRGRRWERTPEGLRASDDMSTALLAAAEVDGGWAFVLDGGLVAASDRFSGALRRVGALPEVVAVYEGSRGRVAALTRDGLWTSDGRTLSRADVPAPVRDAVFVDARQGVVTTLDGDALVTRDGGASWGRVEGVAGPVFEVEAEGCGFALSTASGRVSLRADGAPGVSACASAEGSDEPPPGATETRSSEAEVEALSELRVDELERVPLGGGATVSVEPEEAGGRALVLRARGRPPVRRPIPFHATATWWGPAALLRDHDRDSLWRTRDGRTLEFVFFPTAACRGAESAAVLPSDDGVHLVATCCAFDGASWRPMSLPTTDASWEPIAARGRFALMEGSDGVTTSLRAVDLDTGDSTPVPLDPLRCDVDLAAGGQVVGLCAPQGPDARPSLVMGRAGEALTARPAPAGATRALFADARRGVVRGDDSLTLWRTLDGGERWEPVSVPIEGNYRGQVLSDERAVDRRDERCDERGCRVGNYGVRIEGWGPMEASGGRLHLGVRPPPTPTTTVRCERATSAVAPGAPLDRPWRQGTWTVAAPRGRGGSPELRWTDLDGSEGRERLPRGAVVDRLLARTRGGLLVRGAAGLLFVSRGGVRDLSGELTARLGATPREVELSVAAPTDDGGVAVSLGTSMESGTSAWHANLVLELGADGRVRAARSFPWVSPDAAGLARRDGSWGYGIVSSERTPWFVPLSGGPAQPLGRLPQTLVACAGASPAAASSLSFSQAPIALEGTTHPEEIRVTLELHGATACVRTLFDARAQARCDVAR